jgi:tRNA dimethylallyltransferase
VTQPPLICVVGPTAAGKTALAVELARWLDGEVVGCDASQLYVGLDIGTGKARPAEMRGVPHHLIDVAPPDQPVDAAAYARLADAAIASIHARGRRVVVCGGTGLYLRALVEGLCPAPPIDPAVRADLRARLAAGEVGALHAELAQVDPEAAARIGPADGQRVERALGVHRSTGRTLSAWQAEHAPAAPRYRTVLVGLDRPRADLDARIDRRVDAMFRVGFVDEVRALVDAGHGPELRSLQAIGYRLVAAALAGETTLDEARARMKTATRRYARRQRTWFRALEGVRWFEPPVERGPLAAEVGAPARAAGEGTWDV